MSAFQCECVELNLQTPTEYFGRFVFKPLAIGNGISIGNILRRVLLINLPGIKIVGVRIAGVNHEFSSIPGVREDVLEILLNLKDIVFKSQKPVKSFGRLRVQGPAIVTAACIDLAPDIEVINPSHYIATLAKDSVLEMEIQLEWGKGYALAENQPLNGPIDFLRVDAVFMPVRRVTYTIETLTSESLEKQEQLILDVLTNGSLTPTEAVSFASKTILDWFEPIENLEKKEVYKDIFTQEPTKQDLKKEEEIVQKQDIRLLPIEKLSLSPRAYKALKKVEIKTIGDILNYSRKDLRKIKNLGQKSVQEVIEVLHLRYNIFLE